MADRNLLERELARVREEMESLRSRPDASDRMSALMYREVMLYEQRESTPRKVGAAIWVDRKRLALLGGTGWSNEAMSHDLGVSVDFLEAGAPESFGVVQKTSTGTTSSDNLDDASADNGQRRPARRIMRPRHRRDDTPDPAPVVRRRVAKTSVAPVTIRTVEEAGAEVATEAPTPRRRVMHNSKSTAAAPTSAAASKPAPKHVPPKAPVVVIPPNKRRVMDITSVKTTAKAPVTTIAQPAAPAKRRVAGQLLEDLINALVQAEENAGRPVASSEIRAELDNSPNRQRVFAVLVQLENMGCVSRTGKNRGTRWRLA